jgi:hypothetical protein
MQEFELQVLREIAGKSPQGTHKSLVAAAVEYLRIRGYVSEDTECRLTEKGRQFLQEYTPVCSARAEGSGDQCELQAGHEGNHACPRTLASYQKRYIEKSRD